MSRILLYDIETAPNLSYTWGKYDQNVISFEREWYILCISYAWLGEDHIYCLSLPDYTRYSKSKSDDTALVRDFYGVLDEADIVIGHNSDKFDNKKVNTRFLVNGIVRPPSPYKSIDTLKEVRKNFGFSSNRLNDLCKQLDLGEKVKHRGIDLWLGCMGGDPECWDQMVEYAYQDVNLLEQLYLLIRPWMPHHPHVAIDSEVPSCPVCGSTSLHRRGHSRTKVSLYPRFHCQDCGKYSRGRGISFSKQPITT